MKDFSQQMYSMLLSAFKESGYTIIPCEQLFQEISMDGLLLALRHDVDRLPGKALEMAKLEKDLGFSSSYYFRIVEKSCDEVIIKMICDMGHEIGYHYEDLALRRGDHDKAYAGFVKNLDLLRQLCSVKTICAHGSPLSRIDNTCLWSRFSYKDQNILGDISLDVDFTSFFYLTDTGRSWNKSAVSIRDKVDCAYNLSYRTTFDMLDSLNKGEMPHKVLLNTHPHRWSKNCLEWWAEYIWQNSKNMVKWMLIKGRKPRKNQGVMI
jgi:hypothetical protein